MNNKVSRVVLFSTYTIGTKGELFPNLEEGFSIKSRNLLEFFIKNINEKCSEEHLGSLAKILDLNSQIMTDIQKDKLCNENLLKLCPSIEIGTNDDPDVVENKIHEKIGDDIILNKVNSLMTHYRNNTGIFSDTITIEKIKEHISSLADISTEKIIKEICEKNWGTEMWNIDYSNKKSIEDSGIAKARFSIYPLKANANTEEDTAVYAIWPLKTPCNKPTDWYNALSEEILALHPNCIEIFLVLHNKDISLGRGYSKVEEDKTYKDKIKRNIAIFQHSGDKAFSILDNNNKGVRTSKEIVNDVANLFLGSSVQDKILINSDDLLERLSDILCSIPFSIECLDQYIKNNGMSFENETMAEVKHKLDNYIAKYRELSEEHVKLVQLLGDLITQKSVVS
jgi:hypothetical protein